MLQINPQCETAALRMSGLLRGDLVYLENAAVGLLSPDGSLLADSASSAPSALLSRCILAMYRRYAGYEKTLGAVHLTHCMALIRSGRPGRTSLPGRAALFG